MAQRIEIMNHKEILKVISQAIKRGETIDIYYPRTESSTEGWREIEPISFSAEINSQDLVDQRDEITPGHLLNARFQKEIRSFVLSKIKKARLTGRKAL